LWHSSYILVIASGREDYVNLIGALKDGHSLSLHS
jgi:hypothetical protein